MINVMLVDDEQSALDILTTYISKTVVPPMKIVGAYTNPRIALENVLIKNMIQPVDLIFLDIQMDELSGMDFVRQLSGQAKVILTTARTEYALESYQYNVVDYLLKPIPYDRFLQAVQKVFISMDRDNVSREKTYNVQGEPDASSDDSLFIDVTDTLRGESRRSKVRVRFADIRRIEPDRNYVDIFTKKKKITTLNTLENFLERLPDRKFVRVHKSHVVAIDCIERIETDCLYLDDETRIPLGESFRSSFMESIKDKMMRLR
ncbi:LytTR family DNA-binding domain-containing protein [Spirosoma flavus]